MDRGLPWGPQLQIQSSAGQGNQVQAPSKGTKHIASRYYQLLLGHAAINPYLKDKIRKTDDDRCWWCGVGKQQTRHRLFTERKAWLPQIRKLWKDIGKARGWKHPRAPSGKWLWREKSTETVLAFLGSSRVGCISARREVPEELAEAEDTTGSGSGDEGRREVRDSREWNFPVFFQERDGFRFLCSFRFLSFLCRVARE